METKRNKGKEIKLMRAIDYGSLESAINEAAKYFEYQVKSRHNEEHNCKEILLVSISTGHALAKLDIYQDSALIDRFYEYRYHASPPRMKGYWAAVFRNLWARNKDSTATEN